MILIVALLILSVPALAQTHTSVGETLGGAAPTAPYSTGVGQVIAPVSPSPLSEKEKKPEQGLVVPYPTGGAQLQTVPEKAPGSYYGPEVRSPGQYYPSDVKTDGRYRAPEPVTTPEAQPAEGIEAGPARPPSPTAAPPPQTK